MAASNPYLSTGQGGSSKPVVFIAYPFDEEWIKHSVLPLLRFYGCDAIIGEKLYTEEINIAVGNAIARSNLVVAFLTRDKQLADGMWVSSEWVLQEMGFALGRGVPVVLIREKGVHSHIGGGLAGNIQVISLDAADMPFFALTELRSAIRAKLFPRQADPGLAVCHLAKKGRKFGGKQWWDVWLWIDGSDENLKTIKSVKYEFPKDFEPAAEAGEREFAFGNYAETDEQVLVRVIVRFHSGKERIVRYQLTLPETDTRPVSERAESAMQAGAGK